MILAAITLITALAISSVAIYYSVAGLTAIFSAAVIPIIVMGGALEIGKLVAAVWLHRHWNRAKWWLKTYLVSAVCVLMMITSMGIFGFLSKAHIEQTSEARQFQQKIEQIEGEIDRQQELISTRKDRIENLKNQTSSQDQRLAKKIKQERQEIKETRKQYEREIKEQRELISEREKQNQKRINNLQSRISSIEKDLEKLQTLLNNRDYAQAQALVGTKVDNAYGPKTAAAVEDYRQHKRSQIKELRNKIEDIRTKDPVIQDARKTIAELKKEKRNSIESSEKLIDRLESKQFSDESAQDIQNRIDQIRSEITKANKKIEGLTQKKYNFQDKYSKFEAEVGPIKYIAEFIYGEKSDRSSLEDAVRWVIVMIIFVFDPLAVLLLISSQEAIRMAREEKRNKGKGPSSGLNFLGGYQPVGPEGSKVKDPPRSESDEEPDRSIIAPEFEYVNENWNPPTKDSQENKEPEPEPVYEDFEVTVNENSEYNNLSKASDSLTVSHEYDDFESFIPDSISRARPEKPDENNETDNETDLNSVAENYSDHDFSEDINEIAEDFTEDPSVSIEEVAESYIHEEEETAYSENNPEKKDTKSSEKSDRLTEKELDDLDQNVHWEKAKRLWKQDNPDKTIKSQKNLYLRGLIDKLPWEDYLSQEHKDIPKKKLISKDNENDDSLRYIQNGEQKDNTIWSRIHRKDE